MSEILVQHTQKNSNSSMLEMPVFGQTLIIEGLTYLYSILGRTLTVACQKYLYSVYSEKTLIAACSKYLYLDKP